MTSYSLHGQGLMASFGKYPLFSNLSFSLKSHEILKIIGANGSGKTTLLRMIAGLSSPSAGTLQWHSHPQTSSLPPEATFISVTPPLKNNLKVFEQLNLWCLLKGVASSGIFSRKTPHLENILAPLQMQEVWDIPLPHLSAGQRQSLNLCQLFITPSPLWILDEPFTHLDDKHIHLLTNAMKHHLSHQGLILMALPYDTPHIAGSLLRLDPFQSEKSIQENERW